MLCLSLKTSIFPGDPETLHPKTVYFQNPGIAEQFHISEKCSKGGFFWPHPFHLSIALIVCGKQSPAAFQLSALCDRKNLSCVGRFTRKFFVTLSVKFDLV